MTLQTVRSQSTGCLVTYYSYIRLQFSAHGPTVQNGLPVCNNQQTRPKHLQEQNESTSIWQWHLWLKYLGSMSDIIIIIIPLTKLVLLQWSIYNLLLSTFAYDNNSLVVTRPCQVLDWPSKRLEFIFKDVLFLRCIPYTQLPGHVCKQTNFTPNLHIFTSVHKHYALF